MLAYLQLRPPLADVLMQNAAFPIVWGFCMLLPDEGEPIVPCAWAKETPATSAATAARVVNVFIRLPPCLVMPACGNRNNGNRETVFRELARFRKKVSKSGGEMASGRESSRPPAQDCRD
jgi:hypothetical protein